MGTTDRSNAMATRGTVSGTDLLQRLIRSICSRIAPEPKCVLPKKNKGQINRGDWIRTSDLYVPNVALYQAEPRPDRMGKAAEEVPPEARSTTPPIRRDRSPCSVCGSSDGTLHQRCIIPNSLRYLAFPAFATQEPLRLPQIHLPAVEAMMLSSSKGSAATGNFKSRVRCSRSLCGIPVHSRRRIDRPVAVSRGDIQHRCTGGGHPERGGGGDPRREDWRAGEEGAGRPRGGWRQYLPRQLIHRPFGRQRRVAVGTRACRPGITATDGCRRQTDRQPLLCLQSQSFRRTQK